MQSPERIEATEVRVHADTVNRTVVLIVMANDRELRITLREEQAQALTGQLESATRDLGKPGPRPLRGQPPKA